MPNARKSVPRVRKPGNSAQKRHATCYTTWTQTPPLRYTNNVYHQAELVIPMLLAALEAAPAVVYWQFPLLPWSRGMLQLMHRSTRLVVKNVTAPEGCRSFGRTGPGDFFHRRTSAPKLREAMLKACKVAPRTVPSPPRAILYLPRAGSGLQSGVRRNFDGNATELLRALRAALPSAKLRVVGTPGAEVHVCEQAALWASADVLLTPNGAHFVNAAFMTAGALLLEGVPWSMRGYQGQPMITRYSQVKATEDSSEGRLTAD